VSRDATHGVHADGASDHLVMLATGPIGPGNIENDFFLECGAGEFGGNPAGRFCRNACFLSDSFRRIALFEIVLCKEFEDGHGFASVGKCKLAE